MEIERNVDTGPSAELSVTSTLDRGTSIKSFVRMIVQRWAWLVVAALLFGVAAFAVTFSQTPEYQSTATLYVTSGVENDSNSAYQGSLASQQRVASYARLIRSDAVVAAALDISGIGLSKEDAAASVSAVSDTDTVLLSITATRPDPVEASALANAVAAAMVNYVSTLEKPSDGGPALARLTIVSPASPSSDPVSPKVVRNVLVAIVAGAIVGLACVVVRDRLDSSVRTAKDIAEVCTCPVLAEVPVAERAEPGNIADFSRGGMGPAEAYRKLRANLGFVNVDSPPRSVLVTSTHAGDGKTTTAINLAIALAESGQRVVLVDADLRKPTVSSRLSINGTVGVSSYLRNDAPLSDLLQPSVLENLSVLASGERPPNPSELLGSDRAQELVSSLEELFDFVVIDMSPTLPVSDAAVMAQWVDGVVFVVRDGSTKKADLSAALLEVSASHTPVVGVVLNAVSFAGRGYTYDYRYGEED
ncbi:polysaccharide biosynthesis tyrosine autokinase [Gordonia sp. VNQ95]|uniref:polysaccharide biosynthesis tyrosine autokinase n=1 Tax=Gordonia sp. VNQ95 TaxID=3156619 RepID=UPI0032B49E9C